MTGKETAQGTERDGRLSFAELPPAPPPIGTVRPIRDVPDEYVFRFELGPAILAQLLEQLRRVPASPIIEAVKMAKYPGFYHIYLNSQPKYIGKASRPIRIRLREHVSKLRGRHGVDLDQVGCKYVFVEDPSLVSVSEDALISFFSEHGLAEWNATGFGSKVTGYHRGRQSASKWAEQFPADITFPITAGTETPVKLIKFVKQVAATAPLTLSIPKKHRKQFSVDHPDPVLFEPQVLPFEEWVSVIQTHLRRGWIIDRQASAWYIVPS